LDRSSAGRFAAIDPIKFDFKSKAEQVGRHFHSPAASQFRWMAHRFVSRKNRLRSAPEAKGKSTVTVIFRRKVVSMKFAQVAIGTGPILAQYPVMHSGRSWRLLLCACWLVSFSILQATPCRGMQTKSNNLAPQGEGVGAHPILVELFTSEGCSSCPPADALLEKLDSTQPVSGAQLIVLSEHVDYWDHDGWKDPNSSAALTERQEAYVHALGLSDAYTPQLIVDGTRILPTGDARQFIKLFQDEAAAPKVPVRIDDVSADAGKPDVLHAHIEADGISGDRSADVYVAVALDRVESQVLRGENGGRHLTHVAVVVQLTKIGKVQKGKSFDDTVQLKLKPGTDPQNVRIVAFVQEPGPGKLLGAAMRRPAS
jgi:hypothetical protein